MDTIILSKLLVTGFVSERTPRIVLKEILMSIGFSMSEEKINDQTYEIIQNKDEKIRMTKGDRYLLSVLNTINITPCKIIPFPIREQDMQKIRRFISKDESNDLLIKELITIKCAQQGFLYNNPILTPAVMYGLIMQNTIYRSFASNTERNEIEDVFNEYKDSFRKVFLISKCNRFFTFGKFIHPTRENIYNEYVLVNNKKDDYNYRRSNISMIAYAIYRYRMDIIDANFNLINIESLSGDSSENGIFYLSHRFNPLIDFRIYTHPEISSLADINEISDLNDETIYNNLCMFYLTNKTFYSCREHYMEIPIEKQTLMGESMKSLRKDVIVYYGIKVELPLEPMHIDDLIGSFTINRAFVNPYSLSRGYFSNTSMKRLLKVCNYHELRRIIREILAENDTITESVDRFKLSRTSFIASFVSSSS